MAVKISIKKNYFFSTAYQILTILTPLITAPYISRIFGAEVIGIYSYTSSLEAFFGIFAALGTATYGQRVIARCRDDEDERSHSFWEIEILSVLTTTVTIAAWFLFIILNPEYAIYYSVLTIQLVAIAFDITWFYAGLEKFVFTVSRSTIVRLVSIISLFVFVHNKSDLVIYILILSIPNLIGNLSMWIPLRRFVNKPVLKDLNIRPHFKETLVYFVPTIAATAYTYIDKVMIGAITHNEAENGYYEQTTKVIRMAYVLVSSMNTVMTARMSYLFQKGDVKEIQKKLNQALSFIMIMSIPITLGICGIADNFVPWFFGDGFDKVKILLKLYSPLVVIQSFHSYLIQQVLIPSGQRARSNIGVIVGSCVNLIFNAIFIPRLQSVGAVFGTIIAETTIAAIYFKLSREYISISMILRYIYRPIFCAAIMLGVVVAIGWGHSGSITITMLQIAIGTLTYFVLMLLLKDPYVKNVIDTGKRLLKRVTR